MLFKKFSLSALGILLSFSVFAQDLSDQGTQPKGTDGSSPSSEIVSVPELRARVNDFAGILSRQDIGRLENSLLSIEKATGSQIAILIMQTIGQETIEQFSIRVADKWQLGSEKEDKGLIILVSIKERKIRIEVGQGLEGDITDVRSSRIIRHVITPQFQKGDVFGGLFLAVMKIAEHLSATGIDSQNNADGFQQVYSSNQRGPKQDSPSLLFALALFAFLALAFSYFRNRKSGKGVKKIMGFFLVFFLVTTFVATFFGSALPLGFMILLLFMTMSARRSRSRFRRSSPMSRGLATGLGAAGLGYAAGRGFGGGFGGGGFGGGVSGGGFSGGGGGFSGGGASGGW